MNFKKIAFIVAGIAVANAAKGASSVRQIRPTYSSAAGASTVPARSAATPTGGVKQTAATPGGGLPARTATAGMSRMSATQFAKSKGKLSISGGSGNTDGLGTSGNGDVDLTGYAKRDYVDNLDARANARIDDLQTQMDDKADAADTYTKTETDDAIATAIASVEINGGSGASCAADGAGNYLISVNSSGAQTCVQVYATGDIFVE